MANPAPTPIKDEEMEEALLRSGYMLESRLESVLRERGFYVQTSAPVPDPNTGKSRELDIYAMNALKLSNSHESDREFIFSVLLIECVNNPQPIAFITKEPQADFLHSDSIKVAGVPVTIPTATDDKSIVEYLGMQDYHHYCKGRIATQWCSFSQKKMDGSNKATWFAHHDDVQFNDLSKLAVAVDYNALKFANSWVPGSEEPINLEFYYPVLVVQGKLVDVQPKGGKLEIRDASHVQFRNEVIRGAQENSYHIDVVTEGYFPKFLDIVAGELKETAQRIQQQDSAMRSAIQQFVQQNKAAAEQRMRQLLERTEGAGQGGELELDAD
jgi:hypothetical protein